MAVTLIAHTEVGSGGAVTFDFSSIPSTYSDLKLVVSSRIGGANKTNYIAVQFNGITTTTYSETEVYAASNSPASASRSDVTSFIFARTITSANTADTFGSFEMYVPNYANTSYNKQVILDYTSEANSSTTDDFRLGLAAQLWRNTAAINRIVLDPNGGDFLQYSTATLYGITKA